MKNVATTSTTNSQPAASMNKPKPRDAPVKQTDARMELCKSFFKKLERLSLIEEATEETKDEDSQYFNTP